MRRLLLTALAFTCSLAQAQGPVLNAQSFAPLDVGNRWEYTLTSNSGSGAVAAGLVVATVDGETMIGGAPYVVLSRQVFGTNGAPTSARTVCAYSRRLGTAPAGSTSLPDYDCASQTALPPTLPYTSGPTTLTTDKDVAVSAQTVRVDSLVVFGSQGSGSGGASSATAWTYATGLGFVGYRSFGRFHVAAGGGTYDNQTTLTFARVAGTVYGASAVGGEVAPAPAAALRLSAAPNPSVGAFRIEALGATGTLAVDVFDALGRRVEVGTVAGGETFTFHTPTAGVYLVRATDEAGRVATQRIVRH